MSVASGSLAVRSVRLTHQRPACSNWMSTAVATADRADPTWTMRDPVECLWPSGHERDGAFLPTPHAGQWLIPILGAWSSTWPSASALAGSANFGCRHHTESPCPEGPVPREARTKSVPATDGCVGTASVPRRVNRSSPCFGFELHDLNPKARGPRCKINLKRNRHSNIR